MTNILIPADPYTVYFMNGCPYSLAAVKLLEENSINYNRVTMSIPELKQQFGATATFPRIFDGDGKLIGGHSELSEMLNNRTKK